MGVQVPPSAPTISNNFDLSPKPFCGFNCGINRQLIGCDSVDSVSGVLKVWFQVQIVVSPYCHMKRNCTQERGCQKKATSHLQSGKVRISTREPALMRLAGIL